METTLTIRISRSTHSLLRELSDQSDATMAAIVDEAVRDYQRKRFWADFDASCTALAADGGAWADHQREAEAWESTLADGLEDQPSERREEKRGRGLPGPR